MNQDIDHLDAWGEEPDWAKEKYEDHDPNYTVNAPEHDEFEEFRTLGARHILVMIDCHPEMFDKEQKQQEQLQGEQNGSHHNNDDDYDTDQYQMCPFYIALEVIEHLLLQCIRDVATSKANKRNGIGVLLYGTNYFHDFERHGDLASNYHLIAMEPPGIKQVQLIRNCMAKKRNLYEEFCVASHKNNMNGSGSNTAGNSLRYPDDILPLRSALHTANKTFQNAKCIMKGTTNIKTVWIFTNRDDPFHNSHHFNRSKSNTSLHEELQKLNVAAKDMTDNGLQIHLYPFPNANTQSCFDWAKCFDSLTTATLTNAKVSNNMHLFDTEDVIDEIMQQWTRIRKVCTLPLLLPGYATNDSRDHSDVTWNANYKCSIAATTSATTTMDNIFLDFYRPISIRKPRGVAVHKKNNKTMKRTTQILVKETGKFMSDNNDTLGDNTSNAPKINNLSTYMLFAGRERVQIKEEEVTLIKQSCHSHPKSIPSLILLGFKANNNHESNHGKGGGIPLFQTLEKSYFAYPNNGDDVQSSSKEGFSALYHAMIRKEVFGIGELIIRNTAISRLVALLPQREVVAGEGKQVWPPGFVISFLPFQNDVRYPTQPGTTTFQGIERNIKNNKNHELDFDAAHSNVMIDAACQLIMNQHASQLIDWGFHFPNPVIRKFWNYIEHVALGEPARKKRKQAHMTSENSFDEESDDEFTLQTGQILESAGAFIQAFQHSLPPSDDDDGRGCAKQGNTNKKLKQNLMKEGFDRSDIDQWMNAYETGRLNECNVDSLKKYLRDFEGEKNIKGRKYELVDRVESYISKRAHNCDIHTKT